MSGRERGGSLEDISGITAMHDLLEDSERARIVCLPDLLDELDDCLFHGHSNFASTANIDLCPSTPCQTHFGHKEEVRRRVSPLLHE